MLSHLLFLAAAGVPPGADSPADTVIQGVVVNGTHRGAPAAGAKVVLLAGKDNQFGIVTTTTSDRNGSFVFVRRDLPPPLDLIYQVGAQWDGIHYPGPRFRLDSQGQPARVELTVHDTVAAPSPLRADVHEIDLNVKTGSVEVTEVIVVNNPSTATYVGAADPNMPGKAPPTLSLTLPEGVAHVTFNKEFDGRNFHLVDGRLVTNVPWPPGKRQVAFIYEVPVENHQLLFQRHLDLPCAQACVAISGAAPKDLVCNLPQVTAPGQVPIGFAADAQMLPASHVLQVQIGQVAVSWLVGARWAALLLLASLLVATTWRLRVRRGFGSRQSQSSGIQNRAANGRPLANRNAPAGTVNLPRPS